MFVKTVYLALLALHAAGTGQFSLTNNCGSSVTVYYGSDKYIAILSAGSAAADLYPAIHRDDGGNTVLNAALTGAGGNIDSVVINTPGDDVEGQIILSDLKVLNDAYPMYIYDANDNQLAVTAVQYTTETIHIEFCDRRDTEQARDQKQGAAASSPDRVRQPEHLALKSPSKNAAFLSSRNTTLQDSPDMYVSLGCVNEGKACDVGSSDPLDQCCSGLTCANVKDLIYHCK
jgi:hypothetical protein